MAESSTENTWILYTWILVSFSTKSQACRNLQPKLFPLAGPLLICKTLNWQINMKSTMLSKMLAPEIDLQGRQTRNELQVLNK